jgi:hypothetical protein
MLHVRVVSPVALTDQLTARLAAAPGVQNVVVRAGAARRPAGDAVEFNAIIGVALGISRRVRSEVRDGLLALGGGFLAAIVLCLLFGLSVRASGATPAAFLQGVRPVADLINKPNVFSVIVAVLAGVVGVVGAAGLSAQRAIWRGRWP